MIPPFDVAASVAAAAPEIGLAALAAAVLLLDAFLPRWSDRLAYAALLGLLGVGAAALSAPAGSAFDGALAADALGLLGRLLVLGATAGVLAAVPSYARSAGLRRSGELVSLILLAAAGASLLAVSADLVVTALALETAAVSAYGAILLRSADRRAPEAAVKYLAAGAVASALLLAGISYLFGAAGSTRYAVIREAVGDGPLALGGAALVLCGIAFKVGAAPFHAWLPDAYEGAPTILTAFLASAVKGAAYVALIRLVADPLLGLSVDLAGVLAALSALSIVWGNAAAFRQRSAKRMLAYSAVAHTGYLLLGLAAAAGGAGIDGVRAAVVYAASYVPLALGAFLAVAAVEGAPGEEDIESFRGLALRAPSTALAVAILMAALAGLPPTLGFVGKFGIFLSAIEAGLVGLALVAAAATVVGAAYYLRIVRTAYADAATEARAGADPAGPRLVEPVAAGAAALALLAGLFPGPLLTLAARAAETLGR